MFIGYTVAFLCIITVCMIWVTFLRIVFFFSTQIIKYVSLSDFQALFYRKALFVEINEFHCELARILLCKKIFFKKIDYDVLLRFSIFKKKRHMNYCVIINVYFFSPGHLKINYQSPPPSPNF